MLVGNLRQFYTPENIALALRPGVVAGLFVLSFVSSVARYLSWSAGLYWWFYLRKSRSWRQRKIQASLPEKKQILREINWSLGSCFVYACLTTVLFVAAIKGWTRIYLNVADHGWLYLIVSIFVMLVLHDAYFYFSHRLSHRSRWLFRRIHRVHHMSTNPTPFADIMFHPVDALIHAGFVPLFVFLLPVHPLAFGIFLTLVTVINAIGHIGYEVFPAGMQKHWLGRWIGQATAHNLHHSKVHCNYGLYFKFWDKRLGTLHPDSEPTFARLTEKGSSN